MVFRGCIAHYCIILLSAAFMRPGLPKCHYAVFTLTHRFTRLFFFSYVSCVAGKPKKAGALMTICLMLGPDFISDEFVVETSDHARLKVALAMNNHFTVSPASLVCLSLHCLL